MKKVVHLTSFAFLLLLSLSACTQKYGIYQSNAYYRQSSKGTQMVNDAGQPVGSTVIRENLIFIETGAGKKVPVISTAWIDGKPYNVQLVAAQPAVDLGIVKEGGRAAVLAPTEGRKWWQLQLTDSPDAKTSDAIKTAMKEGKVVLKGTCKGKPFTYTMKAPEQLEGVLYQ